MSTWLSACQSLLLVKGHYRAAITKNDPHRLGCLIKVTKKNPKRLSIFAWVAWNVKTCDEASGKTKTLKKAKRNAKKWIRKQKAK